MMLCLAMMVVALNMPSDYGQAEVTLRTPLYNGSLPYYSSYDRKIHISLKFLRNESNNQYLGYMARHEYCHWALHNYCHINYYAEWQEDYCIDYGSNKSKEIKCDTNLKLEN